MSKAHLLPGLMGNLRLPFSYGPHEMNFDAEMANAQILDTNFQNMLTVGMVNQVNGLTSSILKLKNKLSIPYELLLSVEGPLVDLRVTEQWFSEKTMHRGRVLYYPPLSHHLIAESQRQQIFEDITEWLKQFGSSAKL